MKQGWIQADLGIEFEDFSPSTLADLVYMDAAGAQTVKEALAQKAVQQAVDAAYAAAQQANRTVAEVCQTLADYWKNAQGDALEARERGEPVHTIFPVPGSVIDTAIQCVLKESGDGEKSPANPYVLTAVSDARVAVMGTNIVQPIPSPGSSMGGAQWTTMEGGYIVVNGTVTASTGGFYLPLAMPLPRNVPITLHMNNAVAMNALVGFAAEKNGNFVGGEVALSGGANTTFTKTFTDSDPDIRYLRFRAGNGAMFDNVEMRPMVSIGTQTHLPYEAYRGEVYDMLRGTTLCGLPNAPDEVHSCGMGLRRTRMLVLDGTEAWELGHTAGGGTFPFYSLTLAAGEFPRQPRKSYVAGSIVCSHYQAVPSSGAGSIYAQATGIAVGTPSRIIIYDPRFVEGSGTTAAWKAYLAHEHAQGTPVTLVYELETPMPFAVAPLTIAEASAGASFLPARNNVWTNAASVALTYRADILRAFWELKQRVETLERGN